ncbi:MAG: acyl-CoA dehydrogenase family protein, partial [Thermoplasmata archaeon]
MTSPPGAARSEWRTRARAFSTAEILPRVEEMERTDRLPSELPRLLAEAGFLGLTLPTAFGGAGASTRECVAVLTELGRASAAVATLLSVHLAVASAPIVTWGTSDQQARFLPALARGSAVGAFALTEAGAGSDAARIACRYRRTAAGYRLDGTKMFITNGGLAGLLVTFATSDPALGPHGLSAFILERGTPGFSVAQRLEKLGLRGSETTELVYDGVELPPEALLGAEGQGLAIALKALTDGRVGIAAVALGVAQAALEEL